MTAAGCPTPDRCPVPDPAEVDLRRLRLVHLVPGRVLDRVHDRAYPVAAFDPSGAGDSRFSPIDGHPHAYLGGTRTVALLETVFHNVHQDTPRLIFAATDLAQRALGRVRIERRLPLVDLRDPALEQLGLDRSQLTATAPAHYPCTREWAQRLLGHRIGGTTTVGLMWNSRVAELAAEDSVLLNDLLEGTASEACVLYDDGSGTMLSDAGGGFDDLTGSTQGRLLIDQIAEQIDAMVVR